MQTQRRHVLDAHLVFQHDLLEGTDVLGAEEPGTSHTLSEVHAGAVVDAAELLLIAREDDVLIGQVNLKVFPLGYAVLPVADLLLWFEDQGVPSAEQSGAVLAVADGLAFAAAEEPFFDLTRRFRCHTHLHAIIGHLTCTSMSSSSYPVKID